MGRRIYDFFFDTDMPMRRYVVRSGTVSLIPSMTIAVILGATGLMNEENAPDLDLGEPIATFTFIVIVAPFCETLLMALGLWMFSFATRRPLRLALFSAILWAVLHSVQSPFWGLGIIWPFFVFSCGYLAWRRRAWWRGIFIATGIHAFQNFFPAILMIVGTLMEMG